MASRADRKEEEAGQNMDRRVIRVEILPDQAGSKIMQVVTPLDDDTPYGPWGGLGIMVLWVIAAVVGGYLLLKRRDAQ